MRLALPRRTIGRRRLERAHCHIGASSSRTTVACRLAVGPPLSVGLEMTPKEYLDRYTYLAISSPFDGTRISCGLTGYGSGWNFRNGKAGGGTTVQKEYFVFREALRKAHHGNANTP